LTWCATATRSSGWAVNFDLTSGYYHCTIREESTEFLGFRVDAADGSTRWYKFTSLPFGLVTAPFEFDRLVKVLVRHWRLADEASLVQYLDDVLAVSDDRDALRSYAQRMLHDFESVGFCINVEKSELEPVDCVTFLGTVCCFRTGHFRARRRAWRRSRRRWWRSRRRRHLRAGSWHAWPG
jgi:hypothetical protein